MIESLWIDIHRLIFDHFSQICQLNASRPRNECQHPPHLRTRALQLLMSVERCHVEVEREREQKKWKKRRERVSISSVVVSFC